MSRPHRNLSLLFAAALLLASVRAVIAQQPTPRPPAHPAQPTRPAQQPESSEPQQTSATYDDWVVQCQTRAGPPVQKACEMEQVTQAQVQGGTRPFSRIAIPRPEKGQPMKLIVQVPVNVSIHTELRIVSGEADPGVAAAFGQCVPSGCFADFTLTDETIKKFGAAAAPGKLTFADAGGHEVAVPISFKGFAQAFSALLKD